MKGRQIAGLVIGLIMIFLGIGAYFSGEPSSQTTEGRIAIGFVMLLGLMAILGAVSEPSKKPAQAPQTVTTVQTVQTVVEPLPPPPPDMLAGAKCTACGREVQADFVACPFCGNSLKAKCPSCGKQVQPEFVACPYCGKALR
ncbi:MAG: zinc ribbon domain-containing protein [Thermoplasmata archaeon]|nr:zinc ribbon domain-containing protein [Thermoplasmata archaeon]